MPGYNAAMTIKTVRLLTFVAILWCLACSAPSEGGPTAADENVVIIQDFVKVGTVDAQAGDFILERLREGSLEERVSAAWALGELEVAGASAALMTAIREDGEAYVKINAARSLGTAGGEGAGELLVSLLDQDDDNLRAAALVALGGDSIPLMCDAVCSRIPRLSDDLRHQAVDLLATRAEPCALPCLVERADDPMAEIRSLVGFGLGRIGSSEGLDPLIRLIEDENHMVRANAAQAMGMIGDPAARPYLEAARKDEYGVVQDAVKEALPKIR